jgi:hypothetical protein
LKASAHEFGRAWHRYYIYGDEMTLEASEGEDIHFKQI